MLLSIGVTENFLRGVVMQQCRRIRNRPLIIVAPMRIDSMMRLLRESMKPTSQLFHISRANNNSMTTPRKRTISQESVTETITFPPHPSSSNPHYHFRRESAQYPFALPRKVALALGLVGVTFLIAVHAYLFHVITSQSSHRSIPEHVDAPLLRPLGEIDRSQYTIRINTWKRVEQLLVSIDHHLTCPGVAQIQVVWCNDQGPVPEELEKMHDERVVIERHDENSLNERFHVLSSPPTLGILSMDDDVLRPCVAIDAGFFQWTENPTRMVGFDARSHIVHDDETWSVCNPLGNCLCRSIAHCLSHCSTPT